MAGFEPLLLSQFGYLMGNTPQPIAKQLLASPAATMSFAAIPQTYSHLMVVVRAKSASTATSFIADNLTAQFNGVTSSNYNLAALFCTQAATVSGAFAGSRANMELGALWNSFTPNTAGAGSHWILIPNYTDTSFAKVLLYVGFATDGGGSVDIHVGGGALAAGTSTAAITSLSFATNSASNFVTNSAAELIGIP